MLKLSFKIALREMRGGLSGFRILILCIALGVGAISGIQSLTSSLTNNLADEGKSILGGDVEISLVHRKASREEKSWLTNQANGKISEIATMRAMARIPQKDTQSLVELKAVDVSYPLIGEVKTSSNEPFQGLLDPIKIDEIWRYPALIHPSFAQRYDLELGDQFEIGQITLFYAAQLINEPDGLSSGIGFGPKILVSRETFEKTGLYQPGTLMNWRYRLLLENAGSPEAIETFKTAANQTFPQAGWRIRSANAAAPQLSENITRFAQFLTLIGITALLVGGVGVSNAVRSFIESKRSAIATLRSLGAHRNLVYSIYFIQVMLISFIGVILGMVLGAIIPYIGLKIIALFLPLTGEFSIFGMDLLRGMVFGLLVGAAFSILPLAKVEDVGVSELFRGASSETTKIRRKRYYFFAAFAFLGLILLAVFSAYQPILALYFILASFGVIAVMLLLGHLIMKAARLVPHFKNPLLSLAISNLHRKGALTPQITLSLGLGLTLLVSISMLDRTITSQMISRLPEKIPSFFFIGIQKSEKDNFDQSLAQILQDQPYEMQNAPMLRGRIVSVKGIMAQEYPVKDSGEWVLRGDRGITFSDHIPEAARLIKGEWWPKDYQGENLVSFKAEEAEALGLDIGDEIIVNVLGREISAKIANLRQQDWESFSINFVMVFSPNALKGAPYPWLSTVTFQDQNNTLQNDRETKVLNEITKDFPTITIIPVKQVMEETKRLIAQIAFAFRGASAVTIIVAILVLSGALAAGQRNRLYDALLLKTLGATKKRVIIIFIFEYGLLGLLSAFFAVLAGSLASYIVAVNLMELNYQFDIFIALLTAVISMIITILLGMISSWHILNVKPAVHLRSL